MELASIDNASSRFPAMGHMAYNGRFILINHPFWGLNDKILMVKLMGVINVDLPFTDDQALFGLADHQYPNWSG